MITSRQNDFIKKIRSLREKKFRDEYGLYVAEGVKSVREAILTGQPVCAVVGTEKALSEIDCGGIKTETVTEEVFLSITGEVNPEGVLCVIEKPRLKKEFLPPEDSCLFLDGVSDPSNVGAIIRTAAAAGYKEVYAADSADPFNPKAVRASMGGIFRVNFHKCDREEFLGRTGIPLIVADMNGKNVFGFTPPEKFCLVIGNEANGVSKKIKSRAAETVKIPMENGMESLNAAVSAGIIMYSMKNAELQGKGV